MIVVEGMIGSLIIVELTKTIIDLHIAQTRKDVGHPPQD